MPSGSVNSAKFSRSSRSTRSTNSAKSANTARSSKSAQSTRSSSKPASSSRSQPAPRNSSISFRSYRDFIPGSLNDKLYREFGQQDKITLFRWLGLDPEKTAEYKGAEGEPVVCTDGNLAWCDYQGVISLSSWNCSDLPRYELRTISSQGGELDSQSHIWCPSRLFRVHGDWTFHTKYNTGGRQTKWPNSAIGDLMHEFTEETRQRNKKGVSNNPFTPNLHPSSHQVLDQLCTGAFHLITAWEGAERAQHDANQFKKRNSDVRFTFGAPNCSMS